MDLQHYFMKSLLIKLMEVVNIVIGLSIILMKLEKVKISFQFQEMALINKRKSLDYSFY